MENPIETSTTASLGRILQIAHNRSVRNT